jgi:hypothetical protein
MGQVTEQGYGLVRYGGKRTVAHRVIYIILGGHIPQDYTLDHLCRVRCCVNPAHLEPVTFAENVLRGMGPTAINGRKLYCNNGHLFNEDNTHLTKSGGRVCRVCEREEYWQIRDAVLLQRKDYYMRNREKVKARVRRYRERLRARQTT